MSEFPVDIGTINPYSIVPVLLLTALLVIASSAAADLSIYWLDPRTRSGE